MAKLIGHAFGVPNASCPLHRSGGEEPTVLEVVECASRNNSPDHQDARFACPSESFQHAFDAPSVLDGPLPGQTPISADLPTIQSGLNFLVKEAKKTVWFALRGI